MSIKIGLPVPNIRISFDRKQKEGKVSRGLLVMETEFESVSFFFLKEDFPDVAKQLRNAADALEKAVAE